MPSYGKLSIFTILASDTDFQNTGLLPASAKLVVKYWQDNSSPWL